jgi:hypothetical protein
VHVGGDEMGPIYAATLEVDIELCSHYFLCAR